MKQLAASFALATLAALGVASEAQALMTASAQLGPVHIQVVDLDLDDGIPAAVQIEPFWAFAGSQIGLAGSDLTDPGPVGSATAVSFSSPFGNLSASTSAGELLTAGAGPVASSFGSVNGRTSGRAVAYVVAGMWGLVMTPRTRLILTGDVLVSADATRLGEWGMGMAFAGLYADNAELEVTETLAYRQLGAFSYADGSAYRDPGTSLELTWSNLADTLFVGGLEVGTWVDVFSTAAVPEPEAAWLWLAGLTVLGALRRRAKPLVAGALLGLTATAATANACIAYQFTDLSALLTAEYGPQGVVSWGPTALNDAGQVVGYAKDGTWAGDRTFLITGSTVQTLTGLHTGDTSEQPRPLNNLGAVAGFVAAAQHQFPRTAAVFSNGALAQLDVPANPAFTQALAVGDSGMVVGVRRDGARDQVFTLRGGQRTDFMNLSQAPVIVGINASDTVAGNRYIGSDYRPFIYDGVSVTDLTPPPGSVAVTASGLNDAGALAVNLSREVFVCDVFDQCYNETRYRAAVFAGGVYVPIPTLDTDYPWTVAINNHGLVAGNDRFGGWLWDGQTITYLDGVLASAGIPPHVMQVLDMNDAGQLLLASQFGGRYWLLTPVPEPGSLAMMALGLMGLALRTRHSRAALVVPMSVARVWPVPRTKPGCTEFVHFVHLRSPSSDCAT